VSVLRWSYTTGEKPRWYTCLQCRRPFQAFINMLYCDDCVKEVLGE